MSAEIRFGAIFFRIKVVVGGRWCEALSSAQALRQSRGVGANLGANGMFGNFHVFKRPQWASGTPPRCRAISA